MSIVVKLVASGENNYKVDAGKNWCCVVCASWEVAYFFIILRYATAGWNISCLSAQQKYGPVKCEDKIRQQGSFLSHSPLSLQYFRTGMKYISCLAWMNKIPSSIVDGQAFEIHTSWSEAKHVLFVCYLSSRFQISLRTSNFFPLAANL